ncbi:MAG: hypothetical protein ACE5EF_08830 [Dehalococcoidia bacterium]
MKLIDPTVRPPDRERQRAPAVAKLDGLRIGLLSNGKANADLMLRETAALFESRHGCPVTAFREKDNASAPARPEMLREVFEACDFMITAMGD